MKKYHLILPAVVSISAASLAVGGVSAGLQAGSCLAQAAERHPATPDEADRETGDGPENADRTDGETVETSVGETGTDETSTEGTAADETSANGIAADETSADGTGTDETSANGTAPDETSADKPWETEPDFPSLPPHRQPFSG